jgi:hypothetical protein
MKRIASPTPTLLLLAAVLTLLVVPAVPSRAAVCTLDNVPAATLLLPYFEVDTADPNGRTTLMAINNASARATLAHVVLWTDLGIPTLSFDIYLTGYDVQSINLRDIFAGHLPQTADHGHDPADILSPKGRLSQDISIPSCGSLPAADLSSPLVDHLRRAHAGEPSASAPRCPTASRRSPAATPRSTW